MYRFRFAIIAITLLTVMGTAPLAALAKEGVITGHIVHISATNIKIRNSGGQVLSFIVVPHFKKVFGSDAHVTRNLKDLRAGDRVKIRYDQNLLGVRKADAIFDGRYPTKKLKD